MAGFPKAPRKGERITEKFLSDVTSAASVRPLGGMKGFSGVDFIATSARSRGGSGDYTGNTVRAKCKNNPIEKNWTLYSLYQDGSKPEFDEDEEEGPLIRVQRAVAPFPGGAFANWSMPLFTNIEETAGVDEVVTLVPVQPGMVYKLSLRSTGTLSNPRNAQNVKPGDFLGGTLIGSTIPSLYTPERGGCGFIALTATEQQDTGDGDAYVCWAMYLPWMEVHGEVTQASVKQDVCRVMVNRTLFGLLPEDDWLEVWCWNPWSDLDVGTWVSARATNNVWCITQADTVQTATEPPTN